MFLSKEEPAICAELGKTKGRDYHGRLLLEDAPLFRPVPLSRSAPSSTIRDTVPQRRPALKNSSALTLPLFPPLYHNRIVTSDLAKVCQANEATALTLRLIHRGSVFKQTSFDIVL